MKRIGSWLAALLLISGIYVTIYAAVQHILRTGANDPQVQMAEDAAARLSQGNPATSLVGEVIDISTSLSPFLIVYDPNGEVLAASARLDARIPSLPSEVLHNTRPDHENRVTWQPQSGVRLASVVVATPQGYVLAGRSLREVERREGDAEAIIGIAWLLSLGVFAIVFVVTVLPVFTARSRTIVKPRAMPHSR